MKRWIGAGLGAAGAALLALALMVGMFWMLDVLPIAAFVMLIVLYAVLSGRPQTSGRTRR